MSGAITFDLDTPDLRFTASGGTTVARTVLPSGVRVLSESVPGARSSSIGFWIAVGSRDEHDAQGDYPSTHGSTHFLEHLLFKGTRRRTALDIAIAFDQVGGEHNALTAKEHTCYYAKVQDQDLDMAIDVLADMFVDSLLDPSEFDNERNVILEELAMADDDPGDVANELFYRNVLGSHPLGRPIGGTPATIRAVTRDAVREHYHEWYQPHRLVVTVAGAVEHDRLVERVTSALRQAGWGLDDIARPDSRRPTSLTPLNSSAPAAVSRPLEQVNLFIGTPALNASDPRRFTMAAFNAILGSGMSSRLFQEIREKRGLAYSVNSFAGGFSDAGVFGIYAGCSAGAVTTVLEVAFEQLESIAETGVSEHELRRALGQLRGASALSLEDSDTRMSRLGRAELGVGEFLDFDAAVERLNAVSLEDVRDMAKFVLSGPFTAAAVGPIDDSVFTHSRLTAGGGQ